MTEPVQLCQTELTPHHAQPSVGGRLPVPIHPSVIHSVKVSRYVLEHLTLSEIGWDPLRSPERVEHYKLIENHFHF